MGNFQGYLIKFGDDIFPHEYIIYESYQTAPDRRLDIDSARDATGLLKRNVLDHMASTVQFDIRPLNGDNQEIVMGFINSHLTDVSHKKVYLTYWNPLTSAYKSGEFYIHLFTDDIGYCW